MPLPSRSKRANVLASAKPLAVNSSRLNDLLPSVSRLIRSYFLDKAESLAGGDTFGFTGSGAGSATTGASAGAVSGVAVVASIAGAAVGSTGVVGVVSVTGEVTSVGAVVVSVVAAGASSVAGAVVASVAGASIAGVGVSSDGAASNAGAASGGDGTDGVAVSIDESVDVAKAGVAKISAMAAAERRSLDVFMGVGILSLGSGRLAQTSPVLKGGFRA